jgi:glycopeptide antibiotics resistance protein
MKEKQNKRILIIQVLCIIYVVIMTWIILFKMQFNYANLPHFRNINSIPFKGSVIINGKIDLDEIVGNTLIFFPLGIYICMLCKKCGVLKKIAAIAGLSLFYEVMQFILAIGATDITDLLSNTSGGICGIFLYYVCSLCLKRNEKVDAIFTILSMIGTILFILLLIILL